MKTPLRSFTWFTLLCLPLLAFAQEGSLAQLEASPRHHEWIAVAHGDRTVHTFVAYPEISEKAPVVLVLHENRGLTDWVRAVADRLAADGCIAVAPDLLSGAAPGGGRTKDFPSGDAAREAIGALPPAQVIADLNAVADHARSLPAANGQLAVAGFCWGGSQTWRFAAARSDLAEAYVFYGTGSDAPDAVTPINCVVRGFYGGNDARVNATIDKSAAAMRAAGKTFEPVIYPGAGHAFMRLGEEPNATPDNHAAMTAAWERWRRSLATLSKKSAALSITPADAPRVASTGPAADCH